MRTHGLLITAALGGAVLFLPGCFGSDDSPLGTSADTSDQAAIEYVVLGEEAALADPDVFYWDDGPAAMLEPIATDHWRRELLSLEKTVSTVIEFPEGAPPRATVDVRAEASGLLHLFVCDAGERTEYVKDFEDTAVRSMILERVRRTDERHRGWRLVALTGVLIESPATTRHIESVRIQAGDVDETITSVTDLVPVEDILSIPADVEVTVTVTTGDPTDQVYLHLRHRRHRVRIQNHGDGTFTGRFMSSDLPGPRHLVVDVLSEGTIYDDVAPYDNVAWGIPWRVEGAERPIGS